MADEIRPRVAVVGGFYDLDADQQLGREARDYAQALGRTLAEAGFGLVVYFSNDKSLEPHVVRGFAAALPPGESAPRIDVRYSEAQLGQVRFEEQDDKTRAKLFHEDTFPGPNWEAPFYRSLAERDSVDAVLLMAGGAVHAQCRPGRHGTRIASTGDRQVPRFGTDTPHGVGHADHGVPVLAGLESISAGCLASRPAPERGGAPSSSA
jgi:hypothetical protein